MSRNPPKSKNSRLKSGCKWREKCASQSTPISAIRDDFPVLLSPTNNVNGASLAVCSLPKHLKLLTDTDLMNVVEVWSCAVVIVPMRSRPDGDGYGTIQARVFYAPC